MNYPYIYIITTLLRKNLIFPCNKMVETLVIIIKTYNDESLKQNN